MSDDGATLDIDTAQLDADADKLVRRYLSAGTSAVANVTKRLERNLEAATRAAVPGRLWRAWTSETYPKSGPARDPIGIVRVNGGARSRGAITFWSQPGTIRGKSGQFLAIPLPAAGARGRLRDLTPGEWERAHPGMRLQFVYRSNRASLLVAVGALNGRSGTFRSLTERRAVGGRGSATVPIFVLLPLVNFRNAVAVEPMVAAAEQELPGEYLAAVSKLG